MKLNRQFKKLGYILFGAVACAALLPTQISAEEIGLKVSPAVINISAVAPRDINSSLLLQNTTKNTITLSIFIKAFVPSGENGSVEYLDETTLLPVQIFDEDEQVNSVTLSPLQEKKLRLFISLPQDQPQEDYYFSVLFVSKPNRPDDSEEKNFTLIRAGVGSHVLLSVGERKKPHVEIAEFSTLTHIDTGPVPFTVRVTNKGDQMVRSGGSITISTIFGQPIGKIELEPVSILKASTRLIAGAYWNQKLVVGPYYARLTLRCCEQGPTLVKTIYFFAFPLKETIVLLTVLGITLALTLRIKAKVKN